LLLRHSGFDIDDRRQKMARNGMERMWRRVLTQLGELLDREQF
jgi:mannitol-1-phosphate/altronate dehydrogenase